MMMMMMMLMFVIYGAVMAVLIRFQRHLHMSQLNSQKVNFSENSVPGVRDKVYLFQQI